MNLTRDKREMAEEVRNAGEEKSGERREESKRNRVHGAVR